MRTRILGGALIALLVVSMSSAQTPMGTGITYQGQLKDGRGQANGFHDLRFAMYDASVDGTQIGAIYCANDVSVTDGVFIVELNTGGEFGPGAFTGDERFLEIDVRADTGTDCADPAGFVMLSPRQPLTAAPYSLHSLGPWQTAGANVFYNAGNVGIGTTAPAHPFDLFSSSFPVANVRSDNTVGTWLNLKNSSAGGINWQLISTGSANGGGPGQLLLGRGSAPNISNPVMTLSQSGNVGIGTLSPGKRLHIGDQFVPNSEGMVRLASRSGAGGSNRVWDIGVPETEADSSGSGYSFVIDDIQLGTDPEFMVKWGTGNVGIGTLTPFGKLDVRGEAPVLAHFEGSSTLGAWLNIKNSTPDGHQWSIISTGTDNGEGPGDLLFYDGTTGMTRMDIDGPTGNVGIGTPLPENKLHVMKGSAGAVTGHANAPLVVENSTNAYINLLSPDANESGMLFGSPTASATAGGVIYNATATPDGFQFRTNGNVSRMVIDSAGDVGIGTTSPSRKLDVRTNGAIGIYGENSSTTGRGVYGLAASASGNNFGVYGQSDSTSGRGVYGFAAADSGNNFGVVGVSDSPTGRGVSGVTTATSGTNYGVLGTASTAATGYAVFATGDMGATGVKPFRIDHPDDPENKYLLHYAAESPEVINFYSETVTLDERGEAVVVLPHYFAKINRRPRYQLTAVGAPMPMLHVSVEIDEAALSAGATAMPGEAAALCSFRIAGGAPGAKVSWRVEAVRNDRWVQQRGAPVEVEKQDLERGTYQHPELYGQPPEMGMNYDADRETSSPAAGSDIPRQG